jgi:hypothetical protein
MENLLQCISCGGTNFGEFVRYGSYFQKCLDCEQRGPATSFIAVPQTMSGTYEVFEIDTENSATQQLIGKGEIGEYIHIIRTEAGKGKHIFLKPSRS